MKRLFVMSVIVLTSFIYKAADAQVRVNVSVNIGSQPDWGPSGYDYAEYYYLPDIDVYYHIPTREYVYLENNRWVTVSSLPVRFRNYDLYRGYKVVINQARPWLQHNTHITKYAVYRGRTSQPLIRDRREVKVVKTNPQPVQSRPVVINKGHSQPQKDDRYTRANSNDQKGWNNSRNDSRDDRKNDNGRNNSNSSRPQRRS